MDILMLLENSCENLKFIYFKEATKSKKKKLLSIYHHESLEIFPASRNIWTLTFEATALAYEVQEYVPVPTYYLF